MLGSRGLVAFDLDGPGGRYCSWVKRRHNSNFSLLKVDFWHGTFSHQCWDPDCKSKYQRLWNTHDYRLPDALLHYRHLFLDPEEFDPCLEAFLVPHDGGGCVTGKPSGSKQQPSVAPEFPKVPAGAPCPLPTAA